MMFTWLEHTPINLWSYPFPHLSNKMFNSIEDKTEFLKEILLDTIIWNKSAMLRANDLVREGYLTYVVGFDSGYYHITEKGLTLLGLN